MMLIGTVLCLGDSLSAGARAELDGHAGLGYPELLPALLDAATPGTNWLALNRGVSGETTRQILQRTPGAVREIAGYPGAKHAVLLAGTNDSKGAGVPLDEWEALYRQTAGWIRRSGVPLVLCTFPPLDPAAMPVFTQASQVWLKAASERVRVMAGEWDCNPYPCRLVELEDLPTSLLCDGVHLTHAGYAELARRVAAGLLGTAPVAPVAPPVAPDVVPMADMPPRRSRRRRDVPTGPVAPVVAE